MPQDERYIPHWVAKHEMNAEDLIQTITQGFFAKPSIAITKDTMLRTLGDYGEITVLFKRDAIDPQIDERNHIYNTDAETGTLKGKTFYEWNINNVLNALQSKYEVSLSAEQINEMTEILGRSRKEELREVVTDIFETTIGQTNKISHEELFILLCEQGEKYFIDKSGIAHDFSKKNIEDYLDVSKMASGAHVLSAKTSRELLTLDEIIDNIHDFNPYDPRFVNAEKIEADKQNIIKSVASYMDECLTSLIEQLENTECFQTMDEDGVWYCRNRIDKEKDLKALALEIVEDPKYDTPIKLQEAFKRKAIDRLLRECGNADLKGLEQFKKAIEGMPLSDSFVLPNSLADKICERINTAKECPIEQTVYYEAKPDRCVGFEEVSAIILPSNLPCEYKDKITTALSSYGIKFIEYNNDLVWDEQKRTCSNNISTVSRNALSMLRHPIRTIKKGLISISTAAREDAIRHAANLGGGIELKNTPQRSPQSVILARKAHDLLWNNVVLKIIGKTVYKELAPCSTRESAPCAITVSDRLVNGKPLHLEIATLEPINLDGDLDNIVSQLQAKYRLYTDEHDIGCEPTVDEIRKYVEAIDDMDIRKLDIFDSKAQNRGKLCATIKAEIKDVKLKMENWPLEQKDRPTNDTKDEQDIFVDKTDIDYEPEI